LALVARAIQISSLAHAVAVVLARAVAVDETRLTSRRHFTIE